jgi:hypothetical protein
LQGVKKKHGEWEEKYSKIVTKWFFILYFWAVLLNLAWAGLYTTTLNPAQFDNI